MLQCLIQCNQCEIQCLKQCNQCGLIKSQALRTLLEDSIKLLQLDLMRASVNGLELISHREHHRGLSLEQWHWYVIQGKRSHIWNDFHIKKSGDRHQYLFLYFKVSKMRMLVRVCTRLRSDVISIGITGGTLSRGVGLSTPVLNSIIITQTWGKSWSWKLIKQTLALFLCPSSCTVLLLRAYLVQGLQKRRWLERKATWDQSSLNWTIMLVTLSRWGH